MKHIFVKIELTIMKLRYQYFENEKLLIFCFRDNFSLDLYQKAAQLSKENFWKNIKSILVDLRHVRLENKKLLIKELIQIRNNSNFGGYKMAYLVDDPKILVNLHLYIENNKSSDYKYFSTLLAAISHLNLFLPVNEIEERIKNLKYSIEND